MGARPAGTPTAGTPKARVRCPSCTPCWTGTVTSARRRSSTAGLRLLPDGRRAGRRSHGGGVPGPLGGGGARYLVMRFGGRWSGPSPCPDGWVINPCPVNGPASGGGGGPVGVAWFTGAHEQGGGRRSRSPRTRAQTLGRHAGGRRPPRGAGRRGHARRRRGPGQLARTGGTQRPGADPEDRAERPGWRPAHGRRSSGARSSGFPRLADAGGEVVIAWRDASMASGSTWRLLDDRLDSALNQRGLIAPHVGTRGSITP